MTDKYAKWRCVTNISQLLHPVWVLTPFIKLREKHVTHRIALPLNYPTFKRILFIGLKVEAVTSYQLFGVSVASVSNFPLVFALSETEFDTVALFY